MQLCMWPCICAFSLTWAAGSWMPHVKNCLQSYHRDGLAVSGRISICWYQCNKFQCLVAACDIWFSFGRFVALMLISVRVQVRSIYGHICDIYGPYMAIYGPCMSIYGPYMAIYWPYAHIWTIYDNIWPYIWPYMDYIWTVSYTHLTLPTKA